MPKSFLWGEQIIVSILGQDNILQNKLRYITSEEDMYFLYGHMHIIKVYLFSRGFQKCSINEDMHCL